MRALVFRLQRRVPDPEEGAVPVLPTAPQRLVETVGGPVPFMGQRDLRGRLLEQAADHGYQPSRLAVPLGAIDPGSGWGLDQAGIFAQSFSLGKFPGVTMGRVPEPHPVGLSSSRASPVETGDRLTQMAEVDQGTVLA